MTEASETQSSTADLLTTGFREAIVVVMGGRGGIGAEVVRQVRALGAKVIIGSSSSGDLHLDTDVLNTDGVVTLQADMTTAGAVGRMAAEVTKACGRVDVLVNSAGFSEQIPLAAIERLTDDLIESVFQANAIGVLATIREFTPLLRKGNAPVIVNVGSVAAQTGQGSNLAYVGAKAAVDAMSIGLAKALAPAIRIVTVAPSALDTSFVKNRPESFIEATIDATPLKRLTTTQEVASAVLAAARVLTATTGVVIPVDGGRHL